jgi:glycerol uptake facilitator-like aquaporin
MTTENLSRRVVAEFLGSAFLLAGIVGSGIMAERLAGGSAALALLANSAAVGAALALLANSAAVGAALVALISTFGGISGAHFNPAVTVADALAGGLAWRDVPLYISAQITGTFLGVAAANLMFDLPVFFASQKVRAGGSQLLSEFVATFGLLAVIWGCVRLRSAVVPFAVAAYIVAAFWFTSSTSFANPAVTLARSMSDTFAGIRPIDVPGFVAVQFVAAISATYLFRWLVPVTADDAKAVVLPHGENE